MLLDAPPEVIVLTATTVAYVVTNTPAHAHNDSRASAVRQVKTWSFGLLLSLMNSSADRTFLLLLELIIVA